jgi:conjugative transfer signal peptidase TraF
MTGLSDSVRSVGCVVTIAAGMVAALFLLCGWAGVRFNSTESLPVGLYITTTGATNLVEFCPAEPFASLAIRRSYRGRGSCPDGAVPLVKPVVAHSGDNVEFSSSGIAVNGRLLRNSAPLAVDSKGRPLTPWPFGCYRVAPRTVWVASSYSPKSFDSRYFGPISKSAIRERVRPLLTTRYVGLDHPDGYDL